MNMKFFLFFVFFPTICWGKTIRDQIPVDRSGIYDYYMDAGDKLDIVFLKNRIYGGEIRMRTSKWGKFAIPSDETNVWGVRRRSMGYWDVVEESELSGPNTLVTIVMSHPLHDYLIIIKITIQSGCFRDWQITLPRGAWKREIWLEDDKKRESFTFPGLFPYKALGARLRLFYPDNTCRRLNKKHARMQ